MFETTVHTNCFGSFARVRITFINTLYFNYVYCGKFLLVEETRVPNKKPDLLLVIDKLDEFIGYPV